MSCVPNFPSVSIDCSFLIAPLVFSYVCLLSTFLIAPSVFSYVCLLSLLFFISFFSKLHFNKKFEDTKGEIKSEAVNRKGQTLH